MRKLILAIMFVIVATTSMAFEKIGPLSGNVTANVLRTNVDNAENRINIVPNLKLGNMLYRGDYVTEFNDSADFTKHQYKTTIGIDLIDNLSARYQYDEFYAEKIITVKGKEKTKIIEWDEHRYGLGYNYKLLGFLGVNIVTDFQVFKNQIADYRLENATVVDTKYLKFRNQIYYDFVNTTSTKYLEKVAISYKVTPNFFITIQRDWQKGVEEVNRLGASLFF